jgi:hypothetical protein
MFTKYVVPVLKVCEPTGGGHGRESLISCREPAGTFIVDSLGTCIPGVAVRVQVLEGKKMMQRRAIAVVHDGLQSYNEAFDKEFFTMKGPRTENIRSVGQRHEGLNQRIERLNGEIRDREIVMRGLDHDETAQIIADGIRINHNFIRRHTALGGKTPAQVSGLDLQLEGIRWKALIERANRSSKAK